MRLTLGIALFLFSALSGTTAHADPILSVLPVFGIGFDSFQVFGNGFDPSCVVWLGGNPCRAISVISSTEIDCTTPAATVPDSVTDVTVECFSTGKTQTLQNAFIYYSPVVLVGNPNNGYLRAGESVVVPIKDGLVPYEVSEQGDPCFQFDANTRTITAGLSCTRGSKACVSAVDSVGTQGTGCFWVTGN
jgi:hypothetical protein